MSKHQWEDFSNPRNRRVLIKGCIKCGVLKGSSPKQLDSCVSTPLEKNTLIRMGWRLADPDKAINAEKEKSASKGLSKIFGSKSIGNKSKSDVSTEPDSAAA